jgi:hypothetical protein
MNSERADDNSLGIGSPYGDSGFIHADGDRVSFDRTLMQNFQCRPFDEAHFQKTSLQFVPSDARTFDGHQITHQTTPTDAAMTEAEVLWAASGQVGGISQAGRHGKILRTPIVVNFC